MSIFNISEKISVLTADIRAYIDTSVEYYKLDVFSKLIKGIVSLVNLLVIGSIFLVFMLFISVAVAMNIGEAMENMSSGYYIVSGFYLLVLVLLIIFGKPLLSKAVLTKYSKIFFNENTQKEVLDDELKHLQK